MDYNRWLGQKGLQIVSLWGKPPFSSVPCYCADAIHQVGLSDGTFHDYHKFRVSPHRFETRSAPRRGYLPAYPLAVRWHYPGLYQYCAPELQARIDVNFEPERTEAVRRYCSERAQRAAATRVRNKDKDKKEQN